MMMPMRGAREARFVVIQGVRPWHWWEKDVTLTVHTEYRIAGELVSEEEFMRVWRAETGLEYFEPHITRGYN